MPESQIKVELMDHMGSDLTVVNAARVSFDKESDWDWSGEPLFDIDGEPFFPQVLKDTDKKLIKYLAKHKHISPFGHAFMSFRVTAPVFVARQLVKHKFLRWNEVSRRYVDSEPEFYTPDVWRKKADNKKQGSSGETISILEYLERNMLWDPYSEATETCLDNYIDLLEKGVCPEQARMVLPQSMMTTWWWSGSLDAFADMVKLRLDPHTQYESRLVAQQVDKLASELFPVSWEALVHEKEGVQNA